MEGILLIDKPLNWTSFDAVNYVRKIVARAEDKKPKNVKVGHTGTLDPLANGLLVLLVGKNYTRRAGELSKLDKTYEAEMTLGQTSTTGDAEGEKTAVSRRQPTQAEIIEALEKFTGEISQIPPAYSAIKVNGRRAYELARAGKAPTLEPRKVIVYEIKLGDYEYPLLKFTVSVSSGTYIRALVEDIGKELGTGAFMSSLNRTRVGEFLLDDATSLKDADMLGKLLQY